MYSYCPIHTLKDYGKNPCPKCAEEFNALPNEARKRYKFVELRFLDSSNPEFHVTRFKSNPEGNPFRGTKGLRRPYTPKQKSIARMDKFLSDHRSQLEDLEISILHFPTIEFYFEER